MTVVFGHPGRGAVRARRRAPGFTLIEMMVVAAVLAILAAIAWPAYREVVRQGNRTDAKAILKETAQFMERYHTTNGTFVGAAVLSAESPRGATGADIRYNISFTAAPTALVYVVQAVPANMQIGDPCGTLTISDSDATTAAAADCW